MAKIFGLQGTITGKLANTVFAVRYGEQLARAYQPVVYNPKSEAQAMNRAKLKLISQLSAVLGPVIAIRRIGSRSPRNLFTKENFPLVGVTNSVASINLNRVQLTQSVVGLPAFSADRTSGTGIAVALDSGASDDFDRVVYVAVAKQGDEKLRLLGSVVATEAGDNGTFPAELPYSDNAVVVYAYGIRVNSDYARTVFGNLTAAAAEQIAKLIVTRALTENDVTLSETLGLTMAVGETTGDSESFNRATVTLVSVGSGAVRGGGRYPIGSYATVTAHPSEGTSFRGWRLGTAQGDIVSTDASYTFLVEQDITLLAEFTAAPVTLTVQSADTSMGTVSGGQTVSGGTSITAHATPASGYRFVNWTENDTVVSTLADYTFTIQRDTTLVAHFEQASDAQLTLDLMATGLVVDGHTYTTGQRIPYEAGGQSTYTITDNGFANQYLLELYGEDSTVLAQSTAKTGTITWPSGVVRIIATAGSDE